MTTPISEASAASESTLARFVRSRVTLALAAATIALPAVWLLITRGVAAIADDTPVHLMRLFVFDQHVRQGEWLPRWIPELYTGYGYPLFNFYAPAMYYVAETLHLGGLGQAAAYGWSYVLAVLFGAVGAAFLASDMYASLAGETDRTPLAPRPSPLPAFWPGLLAAAAYTYATYLLANVFVRGAFGEIGAQALLPWLFWALRRMMAARRPLPSLALGAALLALLAMTHTITFLLALPWLAGYAVVMALALRDMGQPAWKLLAAPVAAALSAALLSAVVWLPQLFERGSLSESAWSTALVLDNLWRWRDFVELDLRFRAVDGGQTPYQLGAIQALLLLAGLILTRRRTVEWWYWVSVAAGCALLLSPLSAPLWANVNALAVVQFPWRLLSIMGPAVAVIGAGAIAALPSAPARALATTVIVAFIVITQAPRPGETPFLTAAGDIDLTLAAVNRFEQAEPAYGAGYDDEFLPRWADLAALQSPAPLLPEVEASVRAASAMTHDGRDSVTSNGAAPLSLTWSQFSFPGWQVTLDGGPAQAAQPDATTGLLNIAVPEGEQTVTFARAATVPAQAGTILTVLGLTLLVLALFFSARRALLLATATTLAAGLVWMSGTQPMPAQTRQASVEFPFAAAPGLDLAGIDAHADREQLTIRPLWLVRANQPALLAEWRLTDAAGRTISALRGVPRFGTWSTAAWRPGSLMQDAAALDLPPGMPAGRYTLALELADGATGAVLLPARDLLQIELPEQPAVATTYAPAATFGQPDALPVATLGGVRATVGDAPLNDTSSVAASDRIAIDLLWHTITPEVYPYQSVIEIVDHALQKVAALDLQVGWRNDVLNLWHDYLTPHERATLRLPDDLPSGRYTLRVAVRDRRTDERVPIRDRDGDVPGDAYTVATFKVLNSNQRQPVTRVAATFGDTIELVGITLSSGTTVQPGETLTATIFYRALGATDGDYTRFLHLHNPALGMAAQTDAQPQNGANPTTSWRQGEAIAEAVVLPVAADAAPGTYRLLLGFYDAANSGVRLPARDRHGVSLPDDAVPLLEMTVASPPSE